MRRHSTYHRNYFHLVFATKNRAHLISSPEEGVQLAQLLVVKAHDLDAYLEEFGCWREHVHLLVRLPPKLALAILYGQMKGFSTYAWRKRYPEKPFAWQDGVYSKTVDPDNCEGLRKYIRSQWKHHESGDLISKWEPLLTRPQGMPQAS